MTQYTAQTVSPFSRVKDPISSVFIDWRPGQPETWVEEFVKKMSISVALGSGALGSQMTPFVLDSSIKLVTADHGVTIRYAKVIPGAISGGLGHFSMKWRISLLCTSGISIPMNLWFVWTRPANNDQGNSLPDPCRTWTARTL